MKFVITKFIFVNFILMNFVFVEVCNHKVYNWKVCNYGVFKVFTFLKSSKFSISDPIFLNYQPSKLSIIKQLTVENYGFIKINPWDWTIWLMITNLRKNYLVPTFGYEKYNSGYNNFCKNRWKVLQIKIKILFLETFSLGDIQYFIVTPHWMCMTPHWMCRHHTKCAMTPHWMCKDTTLDVQ